MRVHALHQHIRTHAPRRTARRARPVRDFRARGKLTLVIVDKDTCVTCEGIIDRFDRETFVVARHCGACHATLAELQ